MTKNNPAKAGDALVIYTSGLGAVDSPVTNGAAAPLDHLVNTVNAVTAMIGEVNANAGLAPRFAVNVTAPAGVAGRCGAGVDCRRAVESGGDARGTVSCFCRD